MIFQQMYHNKRPIVLLVNYINIPAPKKKVESNNKRIKQL